MKNNTSVNLAVSLVEIVISILIFAIAGAIMLNSFAAAKFTQIKANDKVKAGYLIQSNAEMIDSFDSTNDMIEYLSTSFHFKSVSENENIFINYYDKGWNLCDEENKEYIVTVKINNVLYPYGELKNINITSEKSYSYPFIDRNKDTQNVIYEIYTQKFFPNIEGR